MKLVKCLKDNRGSIYTDTVINFILPVIFIAISITSFGAIAKKITVMQSAYTIKRMIETDGKYDTEEKELIDTTLNNQNLVADVLVSPSKDEYSLGETFTVTLSTTADIGTGISLLEVPINQTVQGRCERYNK